MVETYIQPVRIMTFDIKKVLKPGVAVWFGFTAPICAIFFVGVSIALSPWFSWTDNALSDLGVSPIAPVFNAGLILTGILLSLFAIAVARAEHRSRYGFAAAICFLFAGFGVVGVGIFTEATIDLHVLCAMLCFISFLLSCILFGVGWAMQRGVSRSKIFLVLTLLGVIISISMFTVFSLGNPMEFIDLYKNPPSQYITPDGTVDYLRIGAYMRELMETRYNITVPGIAIMELLCVLPILPLYTLFNMRLYQKRGKI
jgi:hypothetical membrane protein